MKWRGLEEAQSGLGHATLQAALEERRALMEKYVPAASLAINRRAVEDLRASAMTKRLLQAGAAAPAFELPDQDGRMVSSAALLASGPVIIVFLRGRWCPFCVATVEAWNEALPQVRAAGAALVGISPQTVHQSYLMHNQHKLGFPLLSDAGNAVARKFGLVYRVPAYQQEMYARTFVNLPFINGDGSWELPLAATFVIRGGHLVYAKAEADYTVRAEPGEVIAAGISS
jgi:peroxiredoxin